MNIASFPHWGRVCALALAGTLAACSNTQQNALPTAAPTSAPVSATLPAPTNSMPTSASLVAAPSVELMSDGIINLTHLNALSEEVVVDDRSLLLTHIYAEAPSYAWVDASGEGIACVDDVARAVIVYLDFHAATGNERALERARAGLNFTMHVQADNGEFFNFVTDREGTINTTGATSYQSMGWWAYRGMWALARGYAAFKDTDPTYAATLQEAYLRTERALGQQIDSVGQYITVHGLRVPAWIPGGAADATGVAVLALAEYQAVAPNDDTAQLLTTLADGLRDYQIGSPTEYPWQMHPHTLNAPGFWHAWGAHQSQALARAGKVLGRTDYVDSARRELDGFFAWQLANERVQEMGAMPFRQGQQAYGTNSIVQAAINVYHATGDVRYAQMAGLHASWFLGNNMAQTAMYNPETGHGYDGIDRELAVNKNAGAESTIEALMALQAVVPVPQAARYLQYQPTEAQSWRVFDVGEATETAGAPRYGRRGWTGEARFFGDRFYELAAGDQIELPIEVPTDGQYLLYVSHMRRAGTSVQASIESPRATQPPVIDGNDDDWAGLPSIASNTTQQVVRGAESWEGAEANSFTLYTRWDDERLYVFADVRDPEHIQNGQGPAVGSGDTLWLYLDTEGKGQRIATKITLAQTPTGPEVWDWRTGFPLPQAELAWSATQGGYRYEAALPWESLRARGITAGKELRIEAGRGFGGNSFMDLSGADPDSAANLLPLQLVEQARDPVASEPQTEQNADTARIAFGMQVDDGEQWMHPQAVSPDRDYLWLDQLTPAPLSLTAGRHILRFSYAGTDPTGTSILDAVMLQPAVASKRLNGPDGTSVLLTFDMLQGTFTIDE